MRSTIFCALLLWCNIAHATNESSLKHIYGEIDRLLPGTYTNSVQLASSDSQAEAYALTTIIKRLNNPALGTTLYYLEEFRDDNPSAVTRIRIYSFTTEETGLRLRLINPTDIKALRGAHADLLQVESLTMADVHLDRDVCMLDINRFDHAIIARMRYHACDRRETWLEYELIIDEIGLWTCSARRSQFDDSLISWQMPAFPCIRQQRLAPTTM
ncbi:MAG: CpcT/CpeT family chromophore lyase [Rhodospirillaceae bacterium]